MTEKSLWKREGLIYFEWHELGHRLEGLAAEIGKNYRPHEVLAIARGGLVPAVFLSHALGSIELSTISIVRNASDEKYSERLAPRLIRSDDLSHLKDKNVLIVDDIVGDGGTLRYAVDYVHDLEPGDIRTASLVVNENSALEPDFYSFKVDDWIVFPWEAETNVGTR